MIRNSKQIKAERNRLRLREVEAKEKIKADWEALMHSFSFGRKSKHASEHIVPPNQPDGEEEKIIASTLAYAGALLGRKLGAKVEEKMATIFHSENGKD